MTADDLDLSYTHLCQALGRVGEARMPVMLAALCLSLLSREHRADAVLPLIDQAEAVCTEGPVPAQAWPPHRPT